MAPTCRTMPLSSIMLRRLETVGMARPDRRHSSSMWRGSVEGGTGGGPQGGPRNQAPPPRDLPGKGGVLRRIDRGQPRGEDSDGAAPVAQSGAVGHGAYPPGQAADDG